MRFDPRKCGNVIVASAILHNFGIEVGDVFQAEEEVLFWTTFRNKLDECIKRNKEHIFFTFEL